MRLKTGLMTLAFIALFSLPLLSRAESPGWEDGPGDGVTEPGEPVEPPFELQSDDVEIESITVHENGVAILDDNVDFGKVKAGNSKTKEWSSAKNDSGKDLYTKQFLFLAGEGLYAQGDPTPVKPKQKYKIRFTFYKPFGTAPRDYQGRFLVELWDKATYHRTYDIKLKAKLVN